MLVWARRVGEELIIADDITLKVLSVTGKIVRLGFKAPDGTRIERVVKTDSPAPDPKEKSKR